MAETVAERIGLHRRELRAWAMYDWANSAFFTTVVTTIFPPFFQKISGTTPEQAIQRFATATIISMIVTALLSPALGALADTGALKKKLLAASLAVGSAATAAMWFIGPGDWLLACVLFIVASVGANASLVFYDALLPHIAAPHEVDRASTAGYAIGYLGGGVLLGINMLWFSKPHWFGIPDADMAVRLSFLSVAVWWVGFAVPLFRQVREPPAVAAPVPRTFREVTVDSVKQLGRTARELRRYRHAMLLLVAFMLYNDGIQTIFRFATSYGKGIGLPQSSLITAILLVQFVGVPFTFLFGPIARRFGTKRSIYATLVIYVFVCIGGYFMQTAAHFYALAFGVSLVQGGCQALSRSLFSSMIPARKSAEFFAIYAVFEKAAGVLGPLVFSLTIALAGNVRPSIAAVMVFFILGGLVLTRVDVEAGQAEARRADAD